MHGTYIRKLALGGTVQELGGKGYRLAELYRAGFPVPYGFVLTTALFDEVLAFSGIRLEATLVSEEGRALRLPDQLGNLIQSTYREHFGTAAVVVRSSAVEEDLTSSSFAGVFASVLDVTDATLFQAVLTVYGSALSPNAAGYFRRKGLPVSKARMAVVIQRQIESTLSGVCFTRNPVSGANEYVVEFVEGRNAELTSGQRTPHRVVLSKAMAPTQTWPATGFGQNAPALVTRVAKVSGEIAQFFGHSQDIEWTAEGNALFVLQSRDIGELRGLVTPDEAVGRAPVVAMGLGISRGVATGPARRVLSDLSEQEVADLLHSGDIAIAHSLRLDHLAAMAKCAGVVSGDGSLLSHVAIRTRELGIPCVGGVSNPLSLVTDDEIITIDGTRGGIYRGAALPAGAAPPTQEPSVGYDPLRMAVIEVYGLTVVFERRGEDVIVYAPRPSDFEVATETKAQVAKVLGVSGEKILVDHHTLWEGENAPSTVHYQYEVFRRLQDDPETRGLLTKAARIAERLDGERLKHLLARVDADATKVFTQSVEEFRRYLVRKDRSLAEDAASLLDKAKRLSGDLVGIAVIDVLGESTVRKAASEMGVASLDLFEAVATQGDSPQFIVPERIGSEHRRLFARAATFAKVLSDYKNRRLSVLTIEGYTALDLINDFYRYGLDEIVSRYRW